MVGRIGRAHGLRGEVTVEVRTDDPENRFPDGAVLRTDPPELGPLTVAKARRRPGGLVVSFVGVTDRAGADRLRGTLLVVDPADLPELEDPDEFYDLQLVGLSAVLPDGSPIGTVTDVIHAPASELLVIRLLPDVPVAAPDAAVPDAAVPDDVVGADAVARAGSGTTAGGSTGGGGGREALVPFVRAIVPLVDLRLGRLVVDPPPGLFDL